MFNQTVLSNRNKFKRIPSSLQSKSVLQKKQQIAINLYFLLFLFLFIVVNCFKPFLAYPQVEVLLLGLALKCKLYAQSYETILMLVISQSVCTWQDFSSQFESKAGAYPSKPTLRCSTLVQAPDLTRKHQSMLERPDWDKHCSLL